MEENAEVKEPAKADADKEAKTIMAGLLFFSLALTFLFAILDKGQPAIACAIIFHALFASGDRNFKK